MVITVLAGCFCKATSTVTGLLLQLLAASCWVGCLPQAVVLLNTAFVLVISTHFHVYGPVCPHLCTHQFPWSSPLTHAPTSQSGLPTTTDDEGLNGGLKRALLVH